MTIADPPTSTSALPTLSQYPAGAGSSRPPRVLVVGGGPAGLVTLRNLTTDESAHPGGHKGLDAVLYERREEIGGVWLLDADTLGLEKRNGYPSHAWPIESATHPRFPSPAYPALIGNVYPRFVSFSGQPFPALAHGETFPTLDETFRYLTAVAEPLRPRIKTKREVKAVWELPSAVNGVTAAPDALPASGGWLVHTLDHSTTPPTPLYEHFDAVSFAPSFTTHANWPDVPGLADAIARVPGKIHHAKWYRTPEPFWQSCRIVVVGNGLSTNDIAAQIAARRKAEFGEELLEGEEPIRRAVRHEAVEMFPSLPDDRILESPYITRVELDGTRLHLTLASGEVVTDVDDLIVGTGYQIGVYDWVHVLQREAGVGDVAELRACGVKRSQSGAWDLDVQRLRDSGGLSALSSPPSTLYTPLTPPPRDISVSNAEDLARHPFLIRDSSSPLDSAYPRRVPHLHNHILNARNPTLAFSALIVSFAPFVLADLVSRYIRAVWEGGVRLSGDVEERRRAEVERWALLRERKAELDQQKQKGEKAAVNGNVNGGGEVKAHANGHVPGITAPAPLPPSSLLAYHVLGTSEWPFQQSLHATLLKIKPHYARIPGLTPEEWGEDRDEYRRGMYNAKRRWLEKREEERKARVAAMKVQAQQVSSD